MADDKKAMFQHCERVYNEMAAQATPMRVVDLDAEELQLVSQEEFEEAVRQVGDIPDYDTVLIYEGFLTKLFEKLDLSIPYYSQVRAELIRMDCIRQLKRGGGSAKSVWVLVAPPDLETYKGLPYVARSAMGGRKAQIAFEQRLRDIDMRLTGQFSNLGLAVAELEKRIDKLEKRPDGDS